jgi:hypothetical protein
MARGKLAAAEYPAAPARRDLVSCYVGAIGKDFTRMDRPLTEELEIKVAQSYPQDR